MYSWSLPLNEFPRKSNDIKIYLVMNTDAEKTNQYSPNVNMQLVIIMRIECVSLIIYSSCNIKMRAVAHWSLICALSRCTLSLGLTGALPASSRGLRAQEAMKGSAEVKLGRLHDCRYGYYTSCSELDPYSAPHGPLPVCFNIHSCFAMSITPLL